MVKTTRRPRWARPSQICGIIGLSRDRRRRRTGGLGRCGRRRRGGRRRCRLCRLGRRFGARRGLGRFGDGRFRRLGRSRFGRLCGRRRGRRHLRHRIGRSAGVSLARGSTLALSGLASAGFSAGLALSGLHSSRPDRPWRSRSSVRSWFGLDGSFLGSISWKSTLGVNLRRGCVVRLRLAALAHALALAALGPAVRWRLEAWRLPWHPLRSAAPRAFDAAFGALASSGTSPSGLAASCERWRRPWCSGDCPGLPCWLPSPCAVLLRPCRPSPSLA